MIWCLQYSFPDLEGKTDSKIRSLEDLEELRTKRADKQVMQYMFRFCVFLVRVTCLVLTLVW